MTRCRASRTAIIIVGKQGRDNGIELLSTHPPTFLFSLYMYYRMHDIVE